MLLRLSPNRRSGPEMYTPLRLGQLHEVVHQQRGRHDQRHVLETGHAVHLLDDEGSFGHEHREEQRLGTAGRHLCEHRDHVGVALVHRREGRHPATQFLERTLERLGQSLRVRVAVMDGGRRVEPEMVAHEQGYRLTLKEVVVRRPVVAGMVRRTRISGQVRRQRRRGVGRGDHHHPGIGDQR